MSHFAYTAGRNGTAAAWPDGSTVTPDEFAWFASCAFKSINGDEGGTWAPSSVITIGGAGVAFTTVATTFYGITCSGDFSCGGDAEFHGQTSITGSVTQIGATYSDALDIYATTIFHNPTSWAAACTFNDNIALAGTGTRTFTIAAAYATTFSGNVYLNGNTTLGDCGITAGHSLLSDGEIRANAGIRQPIESITASGAITAGTRYVLANIASGYVVLPTNHPTNAPIEIRNYNASILDVRTSGGSSVHQLTAWASSASGTSFVEVYYDGASWTTLKWGRDSTVGMVGQ